METRMIKRNGFVYAGGLKPFPVKRIEEIEVGEWIVDDYYMDLLVVEKKLNYLTLMVELVVEHHISECEYYDGEFTHKKVLPLGTKVAFTKVMNQC